MSNAEETPQGSELIDEESENEDLDISKEEADAVSGGTAPSHSPSGKPFGA
jgi:hypothetical protein